MAEVKLLDPHLVNKIAAGEVIERPASVVKELVENGLDAGASRIEVTVEHGGLTKIVVADDGVGMSPGDLQLAIRRHTTSKIATEKDLERIVTLGFRGEALASIVEVAKVVITTCARGSEEGVRMEVAGGEVISWEPAGRAPGTTVEVGELFYNTPARRKYLRTEKTENYHLMRTMRRFIFAQAGVHFKLRAGGRTILDAPPSADLGERISALYGPEFVRELIEVQQVENSIRVFGLIGRPEQARGNRGDQFTFVNGRYVRDRSISFAISRAYEGLVKDGRFPPVFLFVEVSPELVDVNVHPRKEEVRFADGHRVQGEVKRAIQAGLLSQQIVPTLEPGRPRQEKGRPREYRRLPEKDRLELDLKREFAEARARPWAPSAPSESEDRWRILGQLHNTYILVQTEEGLELIDQHVAHERILYERFLEQLRDGLVPRQRLLIPITIELPQEEAEHLAEHLGMLDEKLGIKLESFGGGSFILRDWPQALAEQLTKEGARGAIDKLLLILEGGEEPRFAELAARLAAELACAGALPKNTPLAPEEMANLVKELRGVENPYRCPHGRPIIVKYTLEDLERRFGRR